MRTFESHGQINRRAYERIILGFSNNDGHWHAFSEEPMADALAPYKKPMSDGLGWFLSG